MAYKTKLAICFAIVLFFWAPALIGVVDIITWFYTDATLSGIAWANTVRPVVAGAMVLVSFVELFMIDAIMDVESCKEMNRELD